MFCFKKYLQMRKPITAVLLALLVAGCATTNVKVMRYTTEIYAPTQPSSVEILRTKIEGRPYTEIGEVSLRIKKSNEETAVAMLREKAAQLGANALILMGERSVGAIAMPVGSMAVAVPLREIYGVAIKYK